jgi:hypothetical protein
MPTVIACQSRFLQCRFTTDDKPINRSLTNILGVCFGEMPIEWLAAKQSAHGNNVHMKFAQFHL